MHHSSASRPRWARSQTLDWKAVAVYFVALGLALALFAALVTWVDQQAAKKQERVFNEQQALQTLLVRQAIEDHMDSLVRETSILALYSMPEYSLRQRPPASVQTLFQTEQATYPEYLAHLYLPAPGQIGEARYVPTPAGAVAQGLALRWADRHWDEVSASPRLTTPIVPPLYITQTYQMLGLLYPVRVDGDLRGVLAVVIDLHSLIERYIVPMRSGQYGAGYLLDGAGNVVFDHETQIIGRNVFDGLHAQYPDLLRLDQRLITDLAGTDEYRFTVQRGGAVSRKLIAWHTAQVGGQKLVIALSAPDGEIEAALQDLRLQRNLLTAALGVFLLAGSLAFFRVRQRLLEQSARALQAQVEQRTAALQASQESLRALNADLEQRVRERTHQVDAINQELMAVNAELSRALRAKDEFLATMSHELRTPLTGVLGLSESLQLNLYGPLNADQQQAVANLYASGQHLLELISNILDLAKVEAGKLSLEMQAVSVDEVCQASRQAVQVPARQKQIEVKFSLAAEAVMLQADPRRLNQILVNLLSNAVKFTPAGGTVGLDVHVDAGHQVIQFEVWDTGIGIALEAQAQLFQPFVQVNSRLARQYEGTGLGLALVRRLVDLHGGSITLESELGYGSHFKVRLPWTPAATPPATGLAPGAAGFPPGLKILVADDNVVFLRVVANWLRAQGAEVRLAANGLEAVEQARAWRPEILLIDMQMPVMDGLEAIRQIRAQASNDNLSILALTTLAMKGDRETCLAAGATEYLPRPVSLEALTRIILSFARHAPPGPA